MRKRRSGRGGQGTNNKTHQYKKITPRKSIEGHYFYVGSSKQASNYELTAQFVINHIKKTFDRGLDIAEALQTLTQQILVNGNQVLKKVLN